MDAKRVPRSFVPSHASLDKPMQFVNRRIGPNEKPAPRRRTNVKQHHVKLVPLLGNNDFGHHQ